MVRIPCRLRLSFLSTPFPFLTGARQILKLRAPLLAFLLACVACQTPPHDPHKNPSEQHIGNCVGEACGVVAGALLLISVATAPNTRSEKRNEARSLFGRCEVLVEKASPDPIHKKPVPQPCEHVQLIARAAGGFERVAWVDGFDFEMNGLDKGVRYDLEAYSEKFDTRASLKAVRTGTYLKLTLRILVK